MQVKILLQFLNTCNGNFHFLFQARCKGYVARKRFKQLQVQDSAALVIQQNVLSYLEVRDWSWWKLYLKVNNLVPRLELVEVVIEATPLNLEQSVKPHPLGSC